MITNQELAEIHAEAIRQAEDRLLAIFRRSQQLAEEEPDVVADSVKRGARHDLMGIFVLIASLYTVFIALEAGAEGRYWVALPLLFYSASAAYVAHWHNRLRRVVRTVADAPIASSTVADAWTAWLTEKMPLR